MPLSSTPARTRPRTYSAERCSTPLVGEKIDQLLHERFGRRRNGVAGEGPTKILVRYVLGVGVVLAEHIQHVGQPHRIGHKFAERLHPVIHQLVEVNVERGPHAADRGHVDRHVPSAAHVVGKGVHRGVSP